MAASKCIDMNLPTEGVRFRILSNHINEMLCDGQSKYRNRNRKMESVSTAKNRSWAFKTCNYDDGTWWTLRRSKVPDYYYIVNSDGRKMYGSYERGEVGTCPAKIKHYDDQLWTMKPGEEDGTFRLLNQANRGEERLYLRNHRNPNIGLYKGKVCTDQHFRFFFEEIEPEVEIKFSLNDAKVSSKPPKVLLQQEFRNNSSIEQEQSFTVTYNQTKQHRWAYSGGFSISMEMGVSFKVGIPFFGAMESSIQVGTETSHEWTNETVTTESKETSYEFPLTVPAGKRLRAKAVIHEETADVPYEMTIHYKHNKLTEKSWGTWKGMQCVRVQNEVTPF